jgi:hypothetical protein
MFPVMASYFATVFIYVLLPFETPSHLQWRHGQNINFLCPSLISLGILCYLYSHLSTQAESELSDTAKREALDATIAEARLQLLRNLGFSTSTQDDDPKLRALVPPFKVQLRAQTKDLLIEEELRRRKSVVFLCC